jgi:hypothetical protein
MELLGDCGAPDHGAALEHGHFETRRRKVSGTGEAVVAAADDHRIAR